MPNPAVYSFFLQLSMRLILLMSVAIVQAVPPDILRKFAVHLNAITGTLYHYFSSKNG